jgi:hypothetical protein
VLSIYLFFHRIMLLHFIHRFEFELECLLLFRLALPPPEACDENAPDDEDDA